METLSKDNQEKELFDRVLGNIKENKHRVAKGLVNSIPWHFPRFSEKVIGLERKKIYQVTAGPKVGKSKLTNNMLIYAPFDYMMTANSSVNMVVKYFCLEESKEELISQFMSYTLFTKTKGKIVVSPAQLMSTVNELEQEVIDALEEYKDYILKFLTHVEYIEDVAHPFGIFNTMLDYAAKHGKQTKKKVEWKDELVDDLYIPNNPEELVLAVIDHVSLLQPKKGAKTADAIKELSGYMVKLRNKYGYSSVIVQQQALAQTSMEGIKFNQGEPTIANLGDSKLTSRDVNISFGLYSPFANKIPEYEKYDIRFYKDNIRFLTVLQSRSGGTGVKVPLYFHGGVNFYSELPKPDTPEEEKQKRIITQIRNRSG